MTRVACCVLTVAGLSFTAARGVAQLGEAHIGAIVSHGVNDVYGPGAGIVAGVGAGRLAYLGLRAVYQLGSTDSAHADMVDAEVRTRAVVLAVDLGVLFPAGPYEIVPGISLGAVRFFQRGRFDGTMQPATIESRTSGFLAAPGLAVHAHWLGLVVIPEIQYYFVAEPGLTWPVRQRGPLVTVRLVLPLEIGRIRH